MGWACFIYRQGPRGPYILSSARSFIKYHTCRKLKSLCQKVETEELGRFFCSISSGKAWKIGQFPSSCFHMSNCILMEHGRGHRAAAPQKSCIVEYDGASKGNPGQAGAGAVVRHPDGTIAARLSQGLGNATNNAAEYKGAIIGLKYARDNGYTHVSMQGDSQLVTKQVQGEWQTRNPNMADLCKEVRGITDHFTSFEASHVPRGYNTDADVQANRGVHLKDGEVRGEYY